MIKKLFFFIILLQSYNAYSQQKDYAIQAIDFTRVKLTDNFWLPRIETNRTITIPASFARCESTGRVKNFVMAAEKRGKFCTKFPFDDTDIYKTIEGASYSLATYPDARLEAYLDSLIRIIGGAQEPDGYLYTARTIDPLHPHSWAGLRRWEKERELSHELYNAGHLYEAAVAHYLATKKTSLLNIALKNADLVCSVFNENGLHTAPGHEIVEMGLVKLYRITGRIKYLNTAKFFIEQRGHYSGYDDKSKDPWKNGAYWQDDTPVTAQTEAEGHAVRAAYLYSAVADVAALTGDTAFLNTIDRIWDNVVSKKIYVQGSIGAVPAGERFGDDYELPNTTAYNETCAAIASVFWYQRMFQLHGDAKYIDVLEKVLYNGLISGIGLDGKSFFYTNAMQVTDHFSHGALEGERSGWFECSCCPTNLARFIPAVPGYIYAQKQNNIYINLFVNSSTELKVDKNTVNISQQNNYPWDGDLVFNIRPKTKSSFTVLIRIPDWAMNEPIPSDLYRFQHTASARPILKINGEEINYSVDKGYAVLNRTWKPDDKVEVILPMEVKRVVANEKVQDDINKVALQRGPVVYCAEWIDNGGRTSNVLLPDNITFTHELKKDMLNGIVVLRTTAPKVMVSNNVVSTVQRPFVAIPYYAWANRGKGEMQVWFPEQVKDIELITTAK
jgi:DUF1680 family protein